MKRVVITGMGIVSSIGNNKEEVLASLKEGRSGIEFSQEMADYGFRSHVHGAIKLDPADHINRRNLRFMADAAAYAYIAMEQAIEDAGLSEELVSNERTGLIVGSGGASTKNQIDTVDILRKNNSTRRIGPYMVTRTMGSTVSACLATPFKIKGINYSISSACSTSAHCIGNAVEQIQLGKQDVIFAGGGEELHPFMSAMFDAMGALSTNFNDNPAVASRTYDKDRDGFVITGGGGIVVVEELEHALARGAKIYAEITGYGATSDGYDMVAPSGEGAERCMRQAISTVKGDIDYINAHGTSTPAGDPPEAKAIGRVFGDKFPKLTSTKSLTGHALGAAGVHEVIYSLLMMENNFIAASAHIDHLDPEFEGLPIVRERLDNVELNNILSNSFGFGGTNACLVLSKYKD